MKINLSEFKLDLSQWITAESVEEASECLRNAIIDTVQSTLEIDCWVVLGPKGIELCHENGAKFLIRWEVEGPYGVFVSHPEQVIEIIKDLRVEEEEIE